MSVTFSIDANPTGEYALHCYEDGRDLSVHPSREDAALAELLHHPTCDTCATYGAGISIMWDAPTDCDVNLSNASAANILATLGYDADDLEDALIGSADAGEFLNRCLSALAQERDQAAVPAIIDAAPGRATLVECGRAAGYVDDTLTRLVSLAIAAGHLNRRLVWG